MERHTQGRGRDVKRMAKKQDRGLIKCAGWGYCGQPCAWSLQLAQDNKPNWLFWPCHKSQSCFCGQELRQVCHLPGLRHWRSEHPGTLLVPYPGLQASAVTCCSLMAQVPYGNGLRNSRKESPQEIQQEGKKKRQENMTAVRSCKRCLLCEGTVERANNHRVKYCSKTVICCPLFLME